MKTKSNTLEDKKEWHVTESQMITILECAKWALKDAELFDDIADHLDIQDEEMKEIQEKVNDDPAMMHVVKCVNAFPELVAALQQARIALQVVVTTVMAKELFNVSKMENELMPQIESVLTKVKS